jgi:hypothetical protein
LSPKEEQELQDKREAAERKRALEQDAYRQREIDACRRQWNAAIPPPCDVGSAAALAAL